ncbi:MAG: sensor histidine kinase [Sciscionella sp.]
MSSPAPKGSRPVGAPLRLRIAAFAAVITLVVLVALAVLSVPLLRAGQTRSIDTALRGELTSSASAVRRGGAPEPGVRLLDTLGRTLGPAAPRAVLTPSEVDRLAEGLVITVAGRVPNRWAGLVVITPNGTPRLLAASSALLGQAGTRALVRGWLLGAAVLGAALVGLAGWLLAGATLRPVQRMQRAARALPPGERLPVPDTADELRALATELNALLARRDHASDRLRRFTGDAAHELRSPVAAIRAQAEVAVLHPDAEGDHEALADILTESQRLSSLINDLLLLSRSDAGELPAVGAVDLVLAAQSAIQRLHDPAPLVRLEASGEHYTVLAAQHEVELVLDNVLRNAVNYAHNQVLLSVLPDGRRLRLIVDDDGAGIEPRHRDKVFERFYRVDVDRGRGAGGSGLGLALVKELVVRRGGSVRVGSSPLGGARIDLRWPAALTAR